MASFVAKIEEAFFPPMSMEEQIQEMRKQYGLPPSQGFPGQELGDLVDGSGDPRLPGHLQGRREIPDALKVPWPLHSQWNLHIVTYQAHPRLLRLLTPLRQDASMMVRHTLNW